MSQQQFDNVREQFVSIKENIMKKMLLLLSITVYVFACFSGHIPLVL